MIQVLPIQQIGEDERGSTYIFDCDRTGEFIIACRKRAAVAGITTKGRLPYKNPEKLIIMHGSATIHWRNMRGEERGTVQVQSPSWVFIDAWIWHEVVADTDMVLYELNALADGRDDTFRIDE